jgi:hypothetical protein
VLKKGDLIRVSGTEPRIAQVGQRSARWCAAAVLLPGVIFGWLKTRHWALGGSI